MLRRSIAVVFLLAGLTGLPFAPALAAEFYTGGAGGVAIEGTDPVAYFRQSKPVAGKPEFALDWKGVTWRFASAANRDAFKADPMHYAPQYGGYCAWAVSKGYTAKIDPAAWRIVDGKLYLNYSKSVQRTWALDVPGNIAKADRNWPAIRAKLAK